MDLGCIDMGCIEKQSDEAFLDSETSTNGSGLSNSKNRKDFSEFKNPRTFRVITRIQNPLHMCNIIAIILAPQTPRVCAGPTVNVDAKQGIDITNEKEPSPKKLPSQLVSKEKGGLLLEEKNKTAAGGMNSTLDETLGDSNPHYSRVLREKMAVSEAAHKAMETRKAAMVEASWCRILQAARIQSKEAEALLLEAEKTAAEAFETATSIGVIMHDKLDCPRKDYEIETSERSTTALAVTASFETAFEVDKQVAAAVKSAFVKLASCRSINKDEFKELLRKISQHPDIDEVNQDLSELSSECESDAAPEFDPGFHRDSLCSQDLKLDCEKAVEEVRERKYKKKQPFQKFNTTKLVDTMLERLRCLQEDELASLAIIVATCGLNAALEEAENFKQPDLGSASDYTSARALRRISSVGGGARKQFESELPSLDKFLVKRLTKLEREVLEAKNARMNDKEIEEMKGNIPNPNETRGMKLERSRTHNGVMRNMKQDIIDLPSLDKFLVKHVSKLEREVQEAKNRRDFEPTEGGVKVTDFDKKSPSVNPAHIVDEITTPLCCDREQMGKENIDLNKKGDGGLETMKKESRLISKIEKPGEPLIHMQTILEAPETVSLQDGKNESKVIGNSLGKERHGVSDNGIHRYQKKYGGTTSVGDFESLDKVLVKHVSKLEKEKMAMGSKEELVRVKRRDPNTLSDTNEGSLDQILVKHKSRLEKEKMAAAQQPDDRMTHFVSRREARERELQEAWGGIGLGNSIHPHLKRRDPNTESENTEGRLDQILVKHTSRLEKEKIAAAQQPDDQIRHSVSRRDARERELQQAWGGLSFGNSLHPHVSRLERDKASFLISLTEEEERRNAMEV
ncbi:hypothetical protein RHSIM_RhsimUnG0125900 [Rhododendron simsii]|uniref:Uncharacterized protein n=1 Tax=Rhododendron simsii TaxID=118357 RepID=A0A834FVB3_RHOSS|nr:hypothetical protein RHSIM_RhsimUnG0125900 [Rhododendron simsii]